MDSKKIKSALISAYCKDGLEKIVEILRNSGVTIYSTGGTLDFIKNFADVRSVENLTGYPQILGGRVKTLHPKVFGGILGRRDNDSDQQELRQYGIPEIDLVIVDLYPFSETLASGASHEEIIEKIDIGGIALIRAAAKNYENTLVAASRNSYDALLKLLVSKNASSDLEDRLSYACLAFRAATEYDEAITNYFVSKLNGDVSPQDSSSSFVSSSFASRSPFPALDPEQSVQLRYGENPHQNGTFFGKLDEVFVQLHGRELSYNNLLDIDAALELIAEFDEPTYAVLKHNNACGCASDASPAEAWKKALAGDPVSAFGGVIVTNRAVDRQCAEETGKLFFEVILAPAYTEDAMRILTLKKNRIILEMKPYARPTRRFRSALNGILMQDADGITEMSSTLKTVTEKAPSENETADLIFANKLVKHSKSNAIVLARNSQLLASGVGQTSRIDALKQAIDKARSFDFSTEGAVMASDAFFPFPDCVEIAARAGITAIVQPGGSIKDSESTDFCNKAGLSMSFTGYRHFKH
jgi:phosphoribosylaminoimidazolecarboxamide formyltransferase/IMP cyclohydrolase